MKGWLTGCSCLNLQSDLYKATVSDHVTSGDYKLCLVLQSMVLFCGDFTEGII